MADKMVRCQEGHFFDPAKHNACPWCALPADGGTGPERTRPVRAGAVPDGAPPPLPMPANVPQPMPPPMQGPMLGAAPPAMPQAMPQVVPQAMPQAVPQGMPQAVPQGMPQPAPQSVPQAMAPAMQSGAAPSPSAPAVPKPGATRRIGQDAIPGRADPVVGWLVCLDGPDRGRDFRLHSEKNFIGRSPSMDVCILNDDTVSREKHGVVIFDPKKQVFWTLPGDSSGLVYLNGEIVHTPTPFHAHDTLEIGQTKLVLIPFCGDKYTWNPPAAAPAPAPSATPMS